MEEQVYPNLQEICRLCLKENSGAVCIFPKENNLNRFASLSIPMRIMVCAALEVQSTDGLPQKICSECRLQLEKSYYFRKQSQTSDAKLRKHIRLLGMGKKSKVFIKKEDDDDEDDDEYELKDTLDFIKEQEEKEKHLQQTQLDELKNKLTIQYEQELKKSQESFRIKCREELKPLVKEEVRNELRNELRKEFEENQEKVRKQIKFECLIEAKESLREEVLEECRQIEMKYLLQDLETFLMEKKRTTVTPDIKVIKMSATPKIKSPSTSTNNNNNVPATTASQLTSPKESKQTKIIVQKQKSSNIKAEELVLPDNVASDGDDLNADEEDGENDSEGNFLIYDTDDGFELQKNTSDNVDKYTNNIIMSPEEDEYIDSNSITYNEHVATTEESEPTSTTSYHIEDNENGEIKFLKKCSENVNDNVEQSNDDNIMIINFPEAMEQDQIEIGEYIDDYNEAVKRLAVKKEISVATTKTYDNNNKKISILPSSSSSSTFTTSTTSATLEATFLTKTYINPLQRVTDTPKIFKCENCPMVFSTKPSFERHLRSHLKVEKTGVTYQCPECQIVVSCASALRRHMFVHCEEKPFVCNQCGKAFVQKEILKRHMQTHTGIKPHQCPHCIRAFAQRINLTQHINRNHLEQPRIQQHSCHLCPKRFNHASGLSRHLASHSGVAFQCSECDRTFGDRSSIKRHILNMHGKGKVNTKINTK